jgi:chromosome segregation ATPase
MNEDPTQRLSNPEDDRLAQILSAVQNLSFRVEGLSKRVEGLETKVEERLYDTRPIWEKVQADIVTLQEGQKSLAASQQRFEERLEALRDETRTGFRNLKRQFGVLHETFLEARADYKDLDNRVYKIETERDGSL